MSRPKPAGWFPHRGDICWLGLEKKRPVVIISSDSLNARALDVCIVPLTTRERPQFEMRVSLEPEATGLRTRSWAKCDQVNTVAKRFVEYPPAGRVGYDDLRRMGVEIRLALELLD